jgi:hypothetical protein
MKTVIVALIVILNLASGMHCFSNGLDLKIPKKIFEKIDSIFPNANEIKWTKIHRYFQADFIYNHLNISLTFDRDAQIIKSNEEIELQSLPKAILDKINSHYSSYKILIVQKKFRRGNFYYEIEIIKGEYQYVLSYSESGFLQHQFEVIKDDLRSVNVN